MSVPGRSWPPVVLAALLLGCGQAAVRAPAPATIRSLYDRHAMHGTDRRAVVRALGAPDSIEVVAVANRHGAGIDTAITVMHPGWVHHFLRLGASGRELLTGVETTDATLRLPGGVIIGRTTRGDLAERLPPWDELVVEHDTTVVSWQRPDQVAPAWVELALVRDTVRLVRWLPYVD